MAALPEPPPAPEAAPAPAPAPPEPEEVAVPEPQPAPPPAPPPPRTDTFPVSVNARPWAVIEIDGVRVGETPLADVPVRAGRRRFIARMPDGSVMQRTVEVTAETERVVFR